MDAIRKIHEIRLRSNQYVANLNNEIDEALNFVESDIVDLNREQMKQRQKDSEDQNLPEYTSRWKSIKGLTYFNLYDTGSFQKKMKASFKYPQYKITSTDRKLPKLLDRVGERMFGIAPSNRTKAKLISAKAIGLKYISKVWK